MRKKKFEDAVKKLEEILRQLEDQDMELEESLKLFQEGVELYQFCHTKLDEAEEKISMIIDENGVLKQVPFPEGEE